MATNSLGWSHQSLHDMWSHKLDRRRLIAVSSVYLPRGRRCACPIPIILPVVAVTFATYGHFVIQLLIYTGVEPLNLLIVHNKKVSRDNFVNVYILDVKIVFCFPVFTLSSRQQTFEVKTILCLVLLSFINEIKFLLFLVQNFYVVRNSECFC